MPKDPTVTIRPASPGDARAIRALFSPFVEKGIVLPRTEEEIRQRSGDFLVAERLGEIVGCGALTDYGNGLQEVRSLIVRDDCQGLGIGGLLVEGLAEMAPRRGCTRLFALTLRDHFFCRHGFRVVPMDLFPEKVWKDCVVCPKRECCDEIAVLRELPELRG